MMTRTNRLINLFTTACVMVIALKSQGQGTLQRAEGHFDGDMMKNDIVSISEFGKGRRTLSVIHEDSSFPNGFRTFEFEDIEIDILDDFRSTRLHFAVNWRDIDGIEANQFVYFEEGKDPGFWIVSKWIDYEVEEVHAYKLSLLDDDALYITEYINAFSFLGENGETERSTFRFDFQTNICSGQGASSEHYSEKEVPFEISGIANYAPIKVTDGFDFTVGFPDCDCLEFDALDEEEEDFSEDVPYMIVEKMPAFGECVDLVGDERLQCTQLEIIRYVSSNTKYPPVARDAGIQGTVFVYFVVGKDGYVRSVKVLREVDKRLDQEAIRVVKSLPRFEPGLQRGEPISVQYTIPVKFIIRSNPTGTTEDSSTPPALSIQTGSISLSSDDILVANSSEVIRFVLENTGGGLAENLICKTVTSGDDAGINIPNQIEITPIAVGQSQEVRIPVETNADTQDGIARIRVEVIEPRGFSPSPFSMEVPIEAFRAPALEVTDFATKSTIWQPNTPIAVDVLIQNVGRGDAQEVNAELSLSNGVVCFSGNQNEYIGSLAKGEVHKLSYDLMVPRTYAGSNVTLSVTLSEKMGQFGSSWNQTFPFEGEKNETVVVVQGGQRGSTKESGVVRATLGTATNESGEVIFSRTNSSRNVQAIAVIPKDGENCSGRTISGDDLAIFGETAMLGLYTVVDRKFFEQTLEEIKLSMTGLTFENGVLEAGCIENAQGYLFVEHGCLQNQETIKAKLIHCESSEIIWNGLGQGTTAKETFEEIVARLNQE